MIFPKQESMEQANVELKQPKSFQEKRKFLQFQGNVCATDGSDIATIDHIFSIAEADQAGELAAAMLLAKGGRHIVEKLNREGSA